MTFSLTVPPTLANEEGIVRVQSVHSVDETADRFEAAAKAKGIKIFPRFDHAAAAEEYGLSLRPTLVLSFGNPQYGTKFMSLVPLAAIDFPPKALVYEDETGEVWLAYNSAHYLYETIFKRHGLEYSEDEVTFYAKLLKELSAEAVK